MDICGPEVVFHPEKPKEVIEAKVTGIVKWFNVKHGHGFITRNDTDEEVFVHHTEIMKNNPKKKDVSLGDGEVYYIYISTNHFNLRPIFNFPSKVVEFDIVIGENGIEASNVCGPGGTTVKGSIHAADI